MRHGSPRSVTSTMPTASRQRAMAGGRRGAERQQQRHGAACGVGGFQRALPEDDEDDGDGDGQQPVWRQGVAGEEGGDGFGAAEIDADEAGGDADELAGERAPQLGARFLGRHDLDEDGGAEARHQPGVMGGDADGADGGEHDGGGEGWDDPAGEGGVLGFGGWGHAASPIGGLRATWEGGGGGDRAWRNFSLAVMQ